MARHCVTIQTTHKLCPDKPSLFSVTIVKKLTTLIALKEKIATAHIKKT